MQRQDRERARRQKVLHRARAVRLLVTDRGDDAHLRILPADDADASRLAQARRAPVCCHQQRRAQAATVGKRDRDAMLVGGIVRGSGATHQGDRRAAAQLPHRMAAVQAFVLDDIGGGLAAFDGVVVGHEDGTERIVERRSR